MAPEPRRTHYDELGIPTFATEEEIRKAYKQRALETHPDKLGPFKGDTEKCDAEAQFRRVRVAFDVLSDPYQRRAYDYGLKTDQPTGMSGNQQRREYPTSNPNDMEALEKKIESIAREIEQLNQNRKTRLERFWQEENRHDEQYFSQQGTSRLSPQELDERLKRFHQEKAAREIKFQLQEQIYAAKLTAKLLDQLALNTECLSGNLGNLQSVLSEFRV